MWECVRVCARGCANACARAQYVTFCSHLKRGVSCQDWNTGQSVKASKDSCCLTEWLKHTDTHAQSDCFINGPHPSSSYRGGGRGWKRKKRHKLHLRLSQRSGLPWGNPTVPAQTANKPTGLHCDTNSGEQNKVCHQHMRSYIHTIYETKHAHVRIIAFMTAQQTILTSTAAAAKAGCDSAEYGYRLTHMSTSTSSPMMCQSDLSVSL